MSDGPVLYALDEAGVATITLDDPDTRTQLMAVLRAHPGPIAIRLPTDAPIPLDPGYLLRDGTSSKR